MSDQLSLLWTNYHTTQWYTCSLNTECTRCFWIAPWMFYLYKSWVCRKTDLRALTLWVTLIFSWTSMHTGTVHFTLRGKHVESLTLGTTYGVGMTCPTAPVCATITVREVGITHPTSRTRRCKGQLKKYTLNYFFQCVCVYLRSSKLNAYTLICSIVSWMYKKS